MGQIPWQEPPSEDSPALGPSLQPRHCPACCGVNVSMCHGPESETLARRSPGRLLCLIPQALRRPTLSPGPCAAEGFVPVEVPRAHLDRSAAVVGGARP